jgi:hypothetical protein
MLLARHSFTNDSSNKYAELQLAAVQISQRTKLSLRQITNVTHRRKLRNFYACVHALSAAMSRPHSGFAYKPDIAFEIGSEESVPILPPSCLWPKFWDTIFNF